LGLGPRSCLRNHHLGMIRRGQADYQVLILCSTTLLIDHSCLSILVLSFFFSAMSLAAEPMTLECSGETLSGPCTQILHPDSASFQLESQLKKLVRIRHFHFFFAAGSHDYRRTYSSLEFGGGQYKPALVFTDATQCHQSFFTTLIEFDFHSHTSHPPTTRGTALVANQIHHGYRPDHCGCRRHAPGSASQHPEAAREAAIPRASTQACKAQEEGEGAPGGISRGSAHGRYPGTAGCFEDSRRG